MELSHVPKVFWYSVSLAILLITATFSWAALQSNGMTIEIANAKIAITGQLSDLDKVNENLKNQLVLLNKTKAELEKKIRKLELSSNANNKNKKYTKLLKSVNKTLKAKPINEDILINNTKAITDLRKSILQRR